MSTKKCSHCQQELVLSEYYPSTTRDDGLDYMCRLCRISYNARRRPPNKDEVIAELRAKVAKLEAALEVLAK